MVKIMLLDQLMVIAFFKSEAKLLEIVENDEAGDVVWDYCNYKRLAVKV